MFFVFLYYFCIFIISFVHSCFCLTPTSEADWQVVMKVEVNIAIITLLFQICHLLGEKKKVVVHLVGLGLG